MEELRSWMLHDMAKKKKIKNDYYLLKSCLVGARRMLFFMVEQVFLPMEASWLKHNAD